VGHLCIHIAQFFSVTLSQTDRWFALVARSSLSRRHRVAAVCAAAATTVGHPGRASGAFSLYSGGLYALTFRRPARIRTYYLCVVLSSICSSSAHSTTTLERSKAAFSGLLSAGGAACVLLWPGYGLIVAGVASVLYVMSDYRNSRPSCGTNTRCESPFSSWWRPSSDSWRKKDKGDKQHMESLNRELSEKTRKLELA